MKYIILFIFLFVSSLVVAKPIIHSKDYLVVNLDTQEVLMKSNEQKPTSIASITKLMTALVTIEANNLQGTITISNDDVDRLKYTSSRLKIGTTLDKRTALKLALQSSENRAANALLRSYPNGYIAGIRAMNKMAKRLKMKSTTFVDATGLNPKNKSTAEDLAKLLAYALKKPLIREFSTSKHHKFGRLLFINSNFLVRSGVPYILLQKTGFINESKFCLVAVTRIGGNNVAMIFLEAPTKQSRFIDLRNTYSFLRAK